VLLIASRALLVASIIAAFSPLAVATTPPKTGLQIRAR
jgi:hypothetical protein